MVTHGSMLPCAHGLPAQGIASAVLPYAIPSCNLFIGKATSLKGAESIKVAVQAYAND